MKTVDTLVVMPTNRGPQISADLLASVRWSFAGSFHIMLVDDVGNLGSPGTHGDHTIHRSTTASRKQLSGFKTNEGLRLALDLGIKFQQAMVLDDDCLIIGKGIDRWASDTMFGRDDADLIGVDDRVRYGHEWPRWGNTFADWVPEAASFIPTANNIFYAVNWMSHALVKELYDRKVLVPEGYERWDLWPDVWISWMTELLGFNILTWGSMDAPVAPVYANHPNHQKYGPQPWILSDEFKVFHSIKAVTGFTEDQIRERYRRRWLGE